MTRAVDVRAHAPAVEAPKVLVLHERAAVVESIERTLNHGVFAVRGVADLPEAEMVLASWPAVMAVVDMDHRDSGALMRRLGASNTLTRSTIPVLGLTLREDLATRLHAFDLGVDDILSMPFSPRELLARSTVIARRATGTALPILPAIRFGGIEIDIASRRVRVGDTVHVLTEIEQGLLYLLAGSGGRVVSRDELLDAVWGSDYVPGSNVVDRHIRDLRQKLQDDYRAPRFIATAPREGYRFLPVFSNHGWDRRRNRHDRPGLSGTERRRAP